MVTDLFHPFEDYLSLYTHDDFQSSLGSYNSYYFKDVGLFYENIQPHFHSYFDRHWLMANPEKSETHTIEWKYFHFGSFCRDLQKNRKPFSISGHEVVPYLLSLGIHAVFFRYLISS
jgi:hypothetical protein